MDKGKQEAFAENINAKIAEIKKHLAESDPVGNPVSPDNAIGLLSRVDAMQQQEMRLALVRQSKHELARLENALSLIDAGKYGVCNGCREEIPDKRLEAVPDAQMCVPCLSELQGKKHNYLF
jgi:DnaK suppressor protein